MGKRMKRADKVGACVALILGDDELAQNTIGLRVMATGEQKTVPLDDVLAHVQAFTAAQVG
jgi:histidyl-tRNA synthetase